MEKRTKIEPQNTQAERNRRHAEKRPAVAPRLDREVMERLMAEAARLGTKPTPLAARLIVEGLRRIESGRES